MIDVILSFLSVRRMNLKNNIHRQSGVPLVTV